MSSVLVVTRSGERVLAAGSGVLIAKHSTGKLGYVLTCAHNVWTPIGTNPGGAIQTLVNGSLATRVVEASDATRLMDRDLVVLQVVSDSFAHLLPARLCTDAIGAKRPQTWKVDGYQPFVNDTFRAHSIPVKVEGEFQTLAFNGTRARHSRLKTRAGGSRFVAGMSGSGLFDGRSLRGVLRLRENTDDGLTGYAIMIDEQVASAIRSLLGPNTIETYTVNKQLRMASDDGIAPPNPEPRDESLARNDIQKGRWGLVGKRGRYRLEAAELRLHGEGFSFNATLTSDGPQLVAPVIFHLHDSYINSVIHVAPVRGRPNTAFVGPIEAYGAYTLGVQFRDAKGQWQSLELDLASIVAPPKAGSSQAKQTLGELYPG